MTKKSFICSRLSAMKGERRSRRFHAGKHFYSISPDVYTQIKEDHVIESKKEACFYIIQQGEQMKDPTSTTTSCPQLNQMGFRATFM